jgi:hypothetical protein
VKDPNSWHGLSSFCLVGHIDGPARCFATTNLPLLGYPKESHYYVTTLDTTNYYVTTLDTTNYYVTTLDTTNLRPQPSLALGSQSHSLAVSIFGSSWSVPQLGSQHLRQLAVSPPPRQSASLEVGSQSPYLAVSIFGSWQSVPQLGSQHLWKLAVSPSAWQSASLAIGSQSPSLAVSPSAWQSVGSRHALGKRSPAAVNHTNFDVNPPPLGYVIQHSERGPRLEMEACSKALAVLSSDDAHLSFG